MKVDLAIELLLALLANSQRISALIQQARAEGREELTTAEWNQILSADDEARIRLLTALG